MKLLILNASLKWVNEWMLIILFHRNVCGFIQLNGLFICLFTVCLDFTIRVLRVANEFQYGILVLMKDIFSLWADAFAVGVNYFAPCEISGRTRACQSRLDKKIPMLTTNTFIVVILLSAIQVWLCCYELRATRCWCPIQIVAKLANIACRAISIHSKTVSDGSSNNPSDNGDPTKDPKDYYPWWSW